MDKLSHLSFAKLDMDTEIHTQKYSMENYSKFQRGTIWQCRSDKSTDWNVNMEQLFVKFQHYET